MLMKRCEKMDRWMGSSWAPTVPRVSAPTEMRMSPVSVTSAWQPGSTRMVLGAGAQGCGGLEGPSQTPSQPGPSLPQAGVPPHGTLASFRLLQPPAENPLPGPHSGGPTAAPQAPAWPGLHLPVAVDDQAGPLELVPIAQLSQQENGGLLVAPLKVALGHLRRGGVKGVPRSSTVPSPASPSPPPRVPEGVGGGAAPCPQRRRWGCMGGR